MCIRDSFNVLEEYAKKLHIDNKLITIAKYCVYRKLGRKVETLEEAIRSLFESVHLDMFMNLRFKNLTRVFITPNYLVLEFKFKLKPLYGEEERYNTHTYIIGVNSVTDKCFLHKVNQNLDVRGEGEIYITMVPIEINLYHDNSPIYKLLGYDYDIELDSDFNLQELIHKIDKDPLTPNRVRVQGDIVLEILDIENYFNDVQRQIIDQYTNVLILEVVDRIANLLVSYGLSVDVEGNGVRVNGVYRYLRKKSDLPLKVICDLIMRELDLSDILKNYEINVMYDGFGVKTLSIIDKEVQRTVIDIHVNYGRGVFGEPWAPIWVSVLPLDVTASPSLSVWRDIYEYALKHMIEVENVVRHGRHVIQYFGYPRNIVFQYRVYNRDVVFTIVPRWHAVTKWIQITHPEHTPFYFQTDTPFSFTIRNVVNELTPRENHYRIVKLIKQLGNSR